MKIYYDEGMPTVGFSAAGEFRIGEPKEVEDGLAKELLRKGRVKIWEEKEEETRAKTPRRQEKKED